MSTGVTGHIRRNAQIACEPFPPQYIYSKTPDDTNLDRLNSIQTKATAAIPCILVGDASGYRTA